MSVQMCVMKAVVLCPWTPVSQDEPRVAPNHVWVGNSWVFFNCYYYYLILYILKLRVCFVMEGMCACECVCTSAETWGLVKSLPVTLLRVVLQLHPDAAHSLQQHGRTMVTVCRENDLMWDVTINTLSWSIYLRIKWQQKLSMISNSVLWHISSSEM